MAQTDKFVICKYIDENRADIIRRYDEGDLISEIAEIYNVAHSTIYLRLVKWGLRIKKYVGPVRRKNEKPVRQRRKFSPELIEKMKENTRINDKYIKFRGFKHKKDSKEDQELVIEVTKLPVI